MRSLFIALELRDRWNNKVQDGIRCHCFFVVLYNQRHGMFATKNQNFCGTNLFITKEEVVIIF